jgi:predicted ATPase
MSELEWPTGTVTFLFTDIEDSTGKWRSDETTMAAAVAAHYEVLDHAVAESGGVVFKRTGDGIVAAFAEAEVAVAAACRGQERLELPVRMGLHTGAAELRDGDYFGTTLNKAARVMDAGHGGQVLLSSATAALLANQHLTDLGEHSLRGLGTPERIFQIGGGEFPILRAGRSSKGNLPVSPSTFVGRTGDIANLARLVREHQLVTLTGPPGVGKTRLAIEGARGLGESFPDGSWLAVLSSVKSEEGVPGAIAGGLAIQSWMGQFIGKPDRNSALVDTILMRIRHQRLLLIVDNCDRVVDATARIVQRIVETCPNVTVLVTSREPLMIAGEHLAPVQPLPEEDARALLVELARAEAPRLEIDDRQAEAIAELCVQLDCLPLAIEMAARRLRAVTAVELRASLDDPLRVLVAGRRGEDDWHQSLRHAFDVSYERCDQTQRAVFDRLSTVPGAFDLSTAADACDGIGLDLMDVAEALSTLVDRSLVERITTADGTSLYGVSRLLAAYGHVHLDESSRSADHRR